MSQPGQDIEVSIDQLFDAQTSEEQVKEANAPKVIKAGVYKFTASRFDARQVGDDKPNAGRKYVQFSGKAAPFEEGALRPGPLSFKASWERVTYTTDDGKTKQDGQSNVWGQIIKALGLEATTPVPEVVKAVMAYPLKVGVGVMYQYPMGVEGRPKFPRTDEEVAAAEAEGLTPRNYVQFIGKAA